MNAAGRKGVNYHLRADRLYLYGPSTVRALIGRRHDDGTVEMREEVISPPDDKIATVTDGEDGYYVDRQCIPGYDVGGPWWRGNMDLDELEEWLSIYGLKPHPRSLEDGGFIDIEVIKPKEPSDFCDHDGEDGFLFQEEDTIDEESSVMVKCMKCGRMGRAKILHSDIDWTAFDKEDGEDGQQR